MAPDPRVETQNLTRSCNEALILAALRDGPKHGYQLAVHVEERGQGVFRFNHGTLYPILHKLEREGLIRGTWPDEGPRRRCWSTSVSPMTPWPDWSGSTHRGFVVSWMA